MSLQVFLHSETPRLRCFVVLFVCTSGSLQNPWPGKCSYLQNQSFIKPVLRPITAVAVCDDAMYSSISAAHQAPETVPMRDPHRGLRRVPSDSVGTPSFPHRGVYLA